MWYGTVPMPYYFNFFYSLGFGRPFIMRICLDLDPKQSYFFVITDSPTFLV